MNTTYSERLRHPKWQRRRLEILQRDNFTCQLCGDTETILNIHHKEYHKGKIWEYKDDELITYCELCHLVTEHFKSYNTVCNILKIDKSPENKALHRIIILVLMEMDSVPLVSILYYNTNNIELTPVVGLHKNTIKHIDSLIKEYNNG
jgi:hypothetical protein